MSSPRSQSYRGTTGLTSLSLQDYNNYDDNYNDQYNYDQYNYDDTDVLNALNRTPTPIIMSRSRSSTPILSLSPQSIASRPVGRPVGRPNGRPIERRRQRSPGTYFSPKTGRALKPCKENQIRSPITNHCVDRFGKIGRKLNNRQRLVFINPETDRRVLFHSAFGRQLIARNPGLRLFKESDVRRIQKRVKHVTQDYLLSHNVPSSGINEVDIRVISFDGDSTL
jgi:hypothetical protein